MIAALKPENLRITVVESLITATAAAAGHSVYASMRDLKGPNAERAGELADFASAGGDRARRPVPGVRGRRRQVARLSYFVS